MNKYAKSLLELIALTFGVAFLGPVVGDGFDLSDTDALKAAGVAGISAVLALVYGLLVKRLGDRNSALATDTRPDQQV